MKLIKLLLLIFSVFILVSCKQGEYKLKIEDPNKLIINKVKSRYNEGDSIIIQTNTLIDARLNMLVNGEHHSQQTSVLNNNDTYIFEFYLTMPNYDVLITFEITDGFDISPHPFFVETFSNNDYTYEYVYNIDENFEMDYLEEKYGISWDTNYYLITSYEEYYDIHHQLSGSISEPSDTPSEYVWLYIKRLAGASNFIKLDYLYGGEDFFTSYPFENDPGDTAIFTCIDLIRIPLFIYEILEKDETGKLIIDYHQN